MKEVTLSRPQPAGHLPDDLYVPAKYWKGIELRGCVAFCTRCQKEGSCQKIIVGEPDEKDPAKVQRVHITVCTNCDPQPENIIKP